MLQSLNFITTLLLWLKQKFCFAGKVISFHCTLQRQKAIKVLLVKQLLKICIRIRSTLRREITKPETITVPSINEFRKRSILERKSESFASMIKKITYNKWGFRVDSVNNSRSDVGIISSAIKYPLFCCFGLRCCSKLSHCFWFERLKKEHINKFKDTVSLTVIKPFTLN